MICFLKPLPNESKEKKLLDGFRAGRERLREDMKKGDSTGKVVMRWE
ncbi:MAG: hypothetical protein HZA08_02830 [Nitrospirae bacterium]|nr:hypothetical protein [Nitrospirota bacterium]